MKLLKHNLQGNNDCQSMHVLVYDKFFSTCMTHFWIEPSSILRPYPPVYSPIYPANIPWSHRCNLQEPTGSLSQATQASPIHSKSHGSQTAVKELRKQEIANHILCYAPSMILSSPPENSGRAGSKCHSKIKG